MSFKNVVFIDNTYYNNLCQSFYRQLRAISIKSHSKQDLTATMKNLFGKWENEMPHNTFWRLFSTFKSNSTISPCANNINYDKSRLSTNSLDDFPRILLQDLVHTPLKIFSALVLYSTLYIFGVPTISKLKSKN